MFPTETVLLAPRREGAADTHRNPAVSYGEPVEVPGCLVAPGDPSAEFAEDVDDGALVALTVYVQGPCCGLPWRGARVSVRGEPFRVVGDPKPYAGSPTPWSMAVRLERHE